MRFKFLIKYAIYFFQLKRRPVQLEWIIDQWNEWTRTDNWQRNNTSIPCYALGNKRYSIENLEIYSYHARIIQTSIGSSRIHEWKLDERSFSTNSSEWKSSNGLSNFSLFNISQNEWKLCIKIMKTIDFLFCIFCTAPGIFSTIENKSDNSLYFRLLSINQVCVLFD